MADDPKKKKPISSEDAADALDRDRPWDSKVFDKEEFKVKPHKTAPPVEKDPGPTEDALGQAEKLRKRNSMVSRLAKPVSDWWESIKW